MKFFKTQKQYWCFWIIVVTGVLILDHLKVILPDSFLWWIKNNDTLYPLAENSYSLIMTITGWFFLIGIITLPIIFQKKFNSDLSKIWKTESTVFQIITIQLLLFSLLGIGILIDSSGLGSPGGFFAFLAIPFVLFSALTWGFLVFIRHKFLQKAKKPQSLQRPHLFYLSAFSLFAIIHFLPISGLIYFKVLLSFY